MARFDRIQTQDEQLNRLQDRIVDKLDSILANPLGDGVLLTRIALVQGTNRVNHQLGRTLRGWVVVRQYNDPFVLDGWHEVGATGEIAFQNNYQNLDAAIYSTAAWRITPDGSIGLKGTIVRTVPGLNVVAFTLPYAPTRQQVFATASADAYGQFFVRSTGAAGDVVPNVGVNTTWISLDGVIIQAVTPRAAKTALWDEQVNNTRPDLQLWVGSNTNVMTDIWVF